MDDLTPATAREEAVTDDDLVAAGPEGCWVAYYSDRSAVAVFASEIAALRYAVERSMQTKFAPWGEVEF